MIAPPRIGSSSGSRSGPAALIFCAISFLYFGLRLLLQSGSQYVGHLADPQLFIWSFAWFAHATVHGQNPLVSRVIWAPVGINLTWATSVPGLAALFMPLTLLFGAVASYNVAAILLPAAAAWTAFLLFRHLTRSFWPALAGGYLFGFSSYMFGQQEGHVQMTAVFLVPLVALVVLRHVDGELTSRGLVVRLGPLLALQLLFSTELVLTLTLALGGAYLLALALVPSHRARLRSAFAPLVGSYAVAGLLTSPFLYYLATGLHTGAYVPAQEYDADLLNLVVPTNLSLVGHGWARGVAASWPGNESENGAFLGPVALLIAALYACNRWRSQGGRWLIVSLSLTVFFALGSALTIDGHGLFRLPWAALIHRPLFDNVLTDRFSLYISLAGAAVVALWAASPSSSGSGRALRLLLPLLAVLTILPNPSSHSWATDYAIPPFFTDAAYRGCLFPHENILPEPVGEGGDAMLWQVADGFRYRMAGGRIGQVPPSEFMNPPSIEKISRDVPLRPDQAGLVLAYAKQNGVTSVVVDRRQAAVWVPILARIAKGSLVGGVLLYRLSGTASACPSAAVGS